MTENALRHKFHHFNHRRIKCSRGCVLEWMHHLVAEEKLRKTKHQKRRENREKEGEESSDFGPFRAGFEAFSCVIDVPRSP